MKKLIITSLIAAIPIISIAAPDNAGYIDKDVFNICASLVAAVLFIVCILGLVKRILDYQLRSKLIEQQAPEHIIQALTKPDPVSEQNNAVKCVAISISLGIACTLIYCTMPIGLHSLAILFFCLAGGFAVYYFMLAKNKN